MIGFYEFKKFLDSPMDEGVTGTWRYIPPDDKEQLLYDFYMLLFIVPRGEPQSHKHKQAMQQSTSGQQGFVANSSQAPGIDHKLDWVIRETEDIVLAENKKNLLQATFFSICAEMRHVFDSTHGSGGPLALANKVRERFGESTKSKFLEWGAEFHQGLLNPSQICPERGRETYMTQGRDSYVASYKAALNHFRKHDFVNLAEWAFEELEWSSMYGGKAWAGIAKGWKKLDDAKDKRNLYVYIDHIYDLQHNTGTVFNKVPTFAKDNSYNWIKKALDHKRDIIESHELWEKVSSKMRYLAGFALKALHNKTWEGFQRDQKKKGNIPTTKKNHVPAQVAAAGGKEHAAEQEKAKASGAAIIAGGKMVNSKRIKELRDVIYQMSGVDGEYPCKDLNFAWMCQTDMRNWSIWIGYFLFWRYGVKGADDVMPVFKAMWPNQTNGIHWTSGTEHNLTAKITKEIHKVVNHIVENEPDTDWFKMSSHQFKTHLNSSYIKNQGAYWHSAGTKAAIQIYQGVKNLAGEKGTVTLHNGTKLDKGRIRSIKKEILGSDLGYTQPVNQLASIGAVIFRIYGSNKWKDYEAVYKVMFKQTKHNKAEWNERAKKKAQQIVMKWARKINKAAVIPQLSKNPKLYAAWNQKNLNVSDIQPFVQSSFGQTRLSSMKPWQHSYEFMVKVRDDLYGEGIEVNAKFDMPIASGTSTSGKSAHLMHIDQRTAKRIKSIYTSTPNEHGYVAAAVSLMKMTDLNKHQMFGTMRQVLGGDTSQYETDYVWNAVEEEIIDKAQDEVASLVWPHFEKNPMMAAKLSAGQISNRHIIDIYHGMIGNWYASVVLDILENYAKWAVTW